MAVKHLKSKTKAFFEKAFPERQIYHRSGGSVRYVSISPWRQATMAGGATLVVGWCLFATVAVLLRGPGIDIQGGSSDRKTARLERDLRQAKAAEQTALQLLETRTTDFNSALNEAEDRHKTLKRLLANLQGQDTASAIALSGQNASLLIDSTIEEGDPRQSRPEGAKQAANDTGTFRARTDELITEQAVFLDAFEDEAVRRAESARGIIRLTGVSAARVLEQPGTGGPLVQVGLTGTRGRNTINLSADLSSRESAQNTAKEEQLGVNLGLSRRLQPRLSGSLDLSYSDTLKGGGGTTAAGVAGPFNRNFNNGGEQYQSDANLQYQLGKSLNSNLGYSYLTRKNGFNGDVSENVVSIGLNAQF